MIKLMARWETRGKKYWLELWRNDFQGEEAYEIKSDHGYSNLGRDVNNLETAYSIADKRVRESAYYDNINMKPVAPGDLKYYSGDPVYQKNPVNVLTTLLYSDALNILRYRRYENNKITTEQIFTVEDFRAKLKRASTALVGLYMGALNVAIENPNVEVEVIKQTW